MAWNSLVPVEKNWKHLVGMEMVLKIEWVKGEKENLHYYSQVGENIYYKREQGLPPLQASIEGVREMSTVVTLAVVLPLRYPNF